MKILLAIIAAIGLLQSCVNIEVEHAPEQQTAEIKDVICRDLHRLNNLTIIYTEQIEANTDYPAHCYVKGLIDGSITWHMYLPADDEWNGRLVHVGDGGADGDLDARPRLLKDGYAFINSNTGHDTGAEPRAYAFQNDRAARHFAYWAVHTTTTTAKSLVRAYYGKEHEYAYHYGCSTGGRQALLAAQLFPYDFDGIIAGAPAHRQFHRMAHRLNVEQVLFADNFSANLAFDQNGDGRQESLAKLNLLTQRVLEKCDAADGINDGILEPPLCDFDVDRDLANDLCADATDAATCLTKAQIESIKLLYTGSRFTNGDIVYPGAPAGSEPSWSGVFLPHEGNNETPYILRSAAAVIAYSLYRNDPGLLPPDLNNIHYVLDQDAALPEWGWWNFDINDLLTAELSEEAPMMEGNDPDLERFLIRNEGKLLMYHGWADSVIPPEPSLEYLQNVTDFVFSGDTDTAAESIRLFMMPGVGHCAGGPGPDRADFLASLDDWVTHGRAPSTITAQHFSDGTVDNERPLCPYPQRAVYYGPTGGQDLSANWRADNFKCE